MRYHLFGRHKRAALAVVTISTFVLSACSSLSVTTDHAPGVDFSSYQTYGWAKQDSTSPLSLLDAALVRSIDAEMTGKGFTKSGNPDLALVTQASVNEVVTGATVDHWNTGAWGWYGGWGGGMGTSTVNVNRYNQGTLILDMVDVAKNQLVWRGVAEKSVGDNPTVKQDKIDEVVAKLLEDFPPAP